MKKIIPFNNVLKFNTDVREITAISLEPEIKKYPDMISGVFYISGEYKMTDGQLDREKFNFELPFDIALSNNYELDSLLVDIDDFRYDLITDKDLKVNIDLYIDGEMIDLPSKEANTAILSTEETEVEPPLERTTRKETLEFTTPESTEEEDDLSLTNDILEATSTEKTENNSFYYEDTAVPTSEKKSYEESQEEIIEPERIDLLKEMLTTNKEEKMEKEMNATNENNINNNENINNNLFTPEQEEKYVTYRVYKVVENDTIDAILTKYNITKEILADYNDIENITPGAKLIIPANEK